MRPRPLSICASCGLARTTARGSLLGIDARVAGDFFRATTGPPSLACRTIVATAFTDVRNASCIPAAEPREIAAGDPARTHPGRGRRIDLSCAHHLEDRN